MMIEREFEPAFPLCLAAQGHEAGPGSRGARGRRDTADPGVERRFAEAIELGHGDEDMAAVYLASARRG